MLFDTLRRKNQAEQEEREWNANRPADYVSRNKDAMDSLTGQIGSGFDWDTGSKAYQQYRAQAQANAAASAENAQANAAMLAGGYGSSYADSVEKQGQQQALSGIDNAVPGLRGQALSEYQNQQNDLRQAAEECQQWYVDYQAEKDGEMLKLLTDNGMEYNEVPEEGFQEFVSVSQELYPKFKEMVQNDELFDATVAFCGKA